MIKNLSPSRASQFKTCPKQFKFANVDKLKEPTNEVQAKGTTVHQALEDLFDLPKEERSIEKLHNLFRDAWTKVRGNDEHHNLFSNVEEEREWGVDGLKLLNNYMEIEDPTSFEPLERERWVRGSIDDLNLRGILDRMDRNQNGDLIIVDYKSGKAPMAKYKEPRFFALKLYALLIKEELGEMPVELKLIYLKNSTIHTLKITEEDLSNAKNEILEIGKGKNINIEYISANPTGPLHAGHARGAVFGDTLASLLTEVGYSVTREYYINDAGNQIEKLVESSLLRYNELVTNKSIDIPDGLYPGEYLKEVGKTLFKNLHSLFSN